MSKLLNGIMSELLNQCRKPTGWLGRAAAWGMNTGHSEVTDWGLGHISIGKHDTILDVGCGGGETVHKLAGIATEGQVCGIDFSEESVAVSRKRNRQLIQAGRVDIQHSSVSCLPFSDDTVDLVTAVETHYFWPDLVSDMQEILRVLQPGGKLMVIGEAYKGGKYDDRNHKWVEWGNMAYHSVNELGELFSAAGYSDVQVFEEYDRGWLCGIGRKPS
jgi:ubiquinone/menaquinone biosynthesis C-methylase UbiE